MTTLDPAQLVRDFCWTINSPNLLVEDTCVSQFPPVDVGDLDSAALLRFMGQAWQSRVGLYFERLVHFYLEKHLSRAILLRHHQVVEAGRTLGELDFVYRDATGQVIHLETAVKFFLFQPDAQGFDSEFIGPNSADNLHRKYSRLTAHQLPLSKLVREDIDARKIHMKGRIFLNPLIGDPLDWPEFLNRSCLRGKWLHARDIQELPQELRELRFSLLAKPYWLSPSTEPLKNKVWDFEQLCCWLTEHFANDISPNQALYRGFGRPVLFSIMKRASNLYEEVDRLFVVPNAWPHDQPHQS